MTRSPPIDAKCVGRAEARSRRRDSGTTLIRSPPRLHRPERDQRVAPNHVQHVVQVDGRVAMRRRAFHHAADRQGVPRPAPAGCGRTRRRTIRSGPTRREPRNTRGGGPSRAKLLLPPSVMAKPAELWPTTVTATRSAGPNASAAGAIDIDAGVALVHEHIGAGLHLGEQARPRHRADGCRCRRR